MPEDQSAPGELVSARWAESLEILESQCLVSQELPLTGELEDPSVGQGPGIPGICRSRLGPQEPSRSLEPTGTQ